VDIESPAVHHVTMSGDVMRPSGVARVVNLDRVDGARTIAQNREIVALTLSAIVR
jgi:hypothetical protein